MSKCLVLLCILMLVACGSNNNCYSNYDGCDATAVVVATAAAYPLKNH